MRTSRVILRRAGHLRRDRRPGRGAGDLPAGDRRPDHRPGYLLPAFAAVFLGSTQFRGGRFNIWGTVVAVYVLAVGVKGLQLAGAPVWIPDLFNGVALLLAVGFAQVQRSPTARTAAIRRVLRLRLGERSATNSHLSPIPLGNPHPN